jgi:hypothetical protein
MDFNLKDESGADSDPVEIEPGRSPFFWVAVGVGVGLAIIAMAGTAYWMFRPAEPLRTTKASAPPPAPVEPPRAVPPAPAPETKAPSTPRAERRPRTEPVEAPSVEEPAAAPDRGSLQVQTDVPGASVFVDRVFHGPSPITIPNLTLGSHQVNLSAEGYDGIARTVDITPGENMLEVRFREVTLDSAIPVVHKHRMGSCEGRLVASVQGLRYETSNKDDGFSIAFAQLGRFEVDYLKKILRVERRGGRGYDFTDKQPTADALFVFHRDVDKAMKRLGAEQP